MAGPAYRAGDFWRICDVCGFRYRASQTFRRWDGPYVCAADFETRHPQDFVRGRRDIQNVPNPRPEPLNTVIGPLTTSLSADASPSATTIQVASSVRFLATDTIGVMLDAGMGRYTIQSVPDTTSITLTSRLGGNASSGGVVINYSAVSEADIG